MTIRVSPLFARDEPLGIYTSGRSRSLAHRASQTDTRVRIGKTQRSYQQTFDDQCAICLSNLRGGDGADRRIGGADIAQVTACRHQYHRACLETWAAYNFKQNGRLTCPICRVDLVGMDIEVVVGSDLRSSPPLRLSSIHALFLIAANVCLVAGMVSRDRVLIGLGSLVFIAQACRFIYQQHQQHNPRLVQPSHNAIDSAIDPVEASPIVHHRQASYGVVDIV